MSNGPEAIAALKRQAYDMFFLDLMMPRIDGWGVLDYLRNRATGNRPTVFLITAFLDQTVSAADAEVVTGVIYKPVDAEEIARLMAEWRHGANVGATLQRTRHRMVGAYAAV